MLRPATKMTSLWEALQSTKSGGIEGFLDTVSVLNLAKYLFRTGTDLETIIEMVIFLSLQQTSTLLTGKEA